ncbi:MAG: diguanylate cyclase [Planctomycetes bacterium]|nr:diguanylate cyclase [Planctomycetota bacterium]
MAFGKHKQTNLLKKHKSLEETLSVLKEKYPPAGSALENEQDCEHEIIGQVSRLFKDLDSIDFEKIADAAINRIPELFNTSYAALLIYEEKTNELAFVKHSGKEIPPFKINVSARPEPYAVYAMNSPGPILMERLSAYELETRTFFPRTPIDTYLVNSTISIPLVIRNEGVKPIQAGVLILAQRKVFDPFTLDEFQMAFYIGELLATAISNCRIANEIRVIAETDDLTKLMNQTIFFEKLGDEINRSSRYNRNLSLIIMGFDFIRANFDAENPDEAEELILNQAASIIRKSIRKTDWASRYAHDKFAIILTETPLESAKLLAGRLKNGITQNVHPCPHENSTFMINFGVSEFAKGETKNAFVDCAEKDLIKTANS